MPVFLERFFLPFLVLVGGALFITNPMKWTGTQRIEGFVAVFVLALAAAFWLHSQTKRENNKGVGVKRVMIPAGVTPEDMTSIFQDNRYNTNQATRLTQDYIGKWLQYSGRVRDVSGRIIFFIDPKNEHQLGLVKAFFDNGWVDRISVIPRGKEVRVVGQVDELGQDRVRLQHCEVVEDQT